MHDAGGNRDNPPTGVQLPKRSGAGTLAKEELRSLLSQPSMGYQALNEAASVAIIHPDELVLVKKLGEGNYATVEQCVLHGKSVAVKRLKPEMIQNVVEVNGFIKEGGVIARLNNPFVVHIVGLGFHLDGVHGQARDPSSLFMCQELCSGGSLRGKVLAQMAAYNKVQYTYTDGLRWCTQMTWGLSYLHGQQPMIIHRDFKLDNVLLTDSTGDADVKLADFGLIALVSKDGVEGVSRDLTGETGSYLNMAPEMILGETKYDEKVDIFSLGCCIFELSSDDAVFPNVIEAIIDLSRNP